MLNKKFKIALLKERNPDEKRVLFTPKTVKMIIDNGYEVYVESNAGLEVGYSNQEYINSGAYITDEVSILDCDIIFSYKALPYSLLNTLKAGTIIASIMHAEGSFQLIDILVKRKLKAYALEFFQKSNGAFPLAVAGGTIAGTQAALYGIYHLQSQFGGKGILGIRTEYTSPINALIIGSGNVGLAAAETLCNIGANVTVLCRCDESVQRNKKKWGEKISFKKNTQDFLTENIKYYDLIIGAILISTFDTEKMITESMVKSMPVSYTNL
ncbi:hypothetical protein OHW91_17990, partial [Acinetobacter baumannii]|nr:hypothetical protein [Acinetobacter baumannii]